jgi:hypothetical protein
MRSIGSSGPAIPLLLGLGLGLACGETENGDAETGNAETGNTETETGSPAVCDALVIPDTSCGVYEDSDECPGGADSGGSGGETGAGDTGATDTGGSGGSDACDEVEAANAAVVACVQQAETDGIAFRVGYHYYLNGGQYDSTTSYRVAVDGMMWQQASGDSDLCTYSRTTVHGAVDLGDCETWDCMHGRLEAAELVETCEDVESCDGV